MNTTVEQTLKMAQEGNAEAQAEMSEICRRRKDYTGAWSWAYQAAEQNNPWGLYAMGICYVQGSGVEVDLDRAWNLFKRAIKLGCVRAYTGLVSVLTERGMPFSKEAREYVAIAAAANDSKGLYLQSILYRNGIGVIRSERRWLNYLKASAAQDFPSALYDLGVYHISNSSSDCENATGVEMIRKAADQDYVDAIVKLGELYDEGRLVDRDGKIAFELFLKAAKFGDNKAMFELAFCYLQGTGVEPDKVKARGWFYKAKNAGYVLYDEDIETYLSDNDDSQNSSSSSSSCENWLEKEERERLDDIKKRAANNDPEALGLLAECYLFGDAGAYVDFPQDSQKAIELYKKSAELGNTQAAFNLGCVFIQGEGDIEIDVEEGLKWWEMAARRGHVMAITNLGLNLARNEDYQSAAEWLEKAASLNDAVAMSVLARLYFMGMGVEVDEQRAMELAKKSAEEKCPNGYFELARIYLSHNEIEHDVELAIEYLIKAVNGQNIDAKVSLGRIYMGEFGDKYKDLELAEELFANASDKGNLEALYFLGVLYLVELNEYEMGYTALIKAAKAGLPQANDFLAQIMNSPKV